MATTTFTVTHARSSDYRGTASMSARNAMARVVAFLTACMGGTLRATTVDAATVPASGTVTLSTANNVVVTIGGLAISAVPAGASDAATATTVAAAINALATVSDAVVASASGAVVTVTALQSGPMGNVITLAASGTGATASGARLTGGTSSTYTF